MAFVKINSYTRVLDDGKKSLQERQQLIDKNSISKSSEFVGRTKKDDSEKQTKDYKTFCRDLFEDRKYISVLDFNKKIAAHYNNNSTYYRNRMITLNLITIKNKVVYPVLETHKSILK